MEMQGQDAQDGIVRDINILREQMLNVHYYEESHWLAAAVAFPGLCASPVGQDALRRAATIAWQFGFPSVSHWIFNEILARQGSAPSSAAEKGPSPLPPAPDFA
jgi:hypothetical protein